MRSKRIITILLVSLVGLWIFTNRNSQLFNEPKNEKGSSMVKAVVNKVYAQQASNMLKDDELFVINVHIPEQEHISGTDAFIPYNQLSENLAKLPKDQDAPIFVYCRSGSMSDTASKELLELGYTNVSDLVGGINAYREVNAEVGLFPENQDLGTVIYGDVEKTEFTLTNFTPSPLQVTRVSTSCGCTSAKVEKESLESYESTKVSVSFDPAVHKDDTDLGELTRTIYIETDNANFPNLEATITANVIKQEDSNL